MKKSLSWEGYSNGNRIEIIDEVKAAIQNSDGAIMNFNMFSDLALTLSIEIPANRVNDLHQSLSKILSISIKNDEEVKNEISIKEIMIYFNVSFTKGTGNMINEIPDVPG